jgi:hypothetical protein
MDQPTMAFQFLPLLKTLGTIVTGGSAAAATFATMRKSEPDARVEERIQVLEDEAVRAGTALTNLAQHTQTLAEQVRTLTTLVAAQQKKLRLSFIIAVISAGVAAAALFIALRR